MIPWNVSKSEAAVVKPQQQAMRSYTGHIRFEAFFVFSFPTKKKEMESERKKMPSAKGLPFF